MKYAAKKYSNSLELVISDDDDQKQAEINHLTSKLLNELTNDFFGHLEGKSQEYKKIKTIEIYRFFYRFSIEKLQQIVNSPTFLVMILTYLKSTKMESINARPVCQKSLQNYYRALENMINFSKYRNELIMVIQEEQILDKNTY